MAPSPAPDELPDQSGRTAIVTGAAGGLGLVTARELARAGARVVLAVRDVAAGQRAARTVPGQAEVRALDLASLASVRQFAEDWNVHEPVHLLINNAGVANTPFRHTEYGFLPYSALSGRSS